MHGYRHCRFPYSTETEATASVSYTHLEKGAYGIMEPSRRCPILSKEKIDVAVIPCVSADREGRRLGHGAGFYDRFLDGVTFPKILVCYKELMMDQVPVSYTHLDVYKRQRMKKHSDSIRLIL